MLFIHYHLLPLKIETISTDLDGTRVREELWSAFCRGVSSRLTKLELEDLQISGMV